MKIGIIIDFYFENIDTSPRGATAYILGIIKSLAQNNEVDILCTKTDIKNGELFNEGIIFEKMEDISNSFLKEKNYDFVWNVMHHNIDTTGILTFDFLHSHSKIYRHQFVRKPYELFIQRIFDKKRYFSDEKIKEYKKEFKNTDLYFVNSELQKWDYTELVNIDENKIYKLVPFIENIVENTKKYKNKVFTFGMSALSFDSKGGFIFLSALSKLKKVKKNFKVKIIYPKYKKNLIVKTYLKITGLSKYVEFLDFQNNMQDFYNSINCLAVPSREETFGLVVLESMKNKIPVIVSNLSGASDIIKDDENGFIFDIKNNAKNNLFNTLLKVSNNKNLDLIINNAFETAKQHTIKEHCKELTKILEEFYNKNKEAL